MPRAVALLIEREEVPTLDGELNEACWARAAAITKFRQVEPREGAEPSERTEVRFVYDRRALYVGIRCFDREPHKIIARELQRDSISDATMPGEDSIGIVFDPFGRERDGYVFTVNPLGAMADGRIENTSTTLVEWDGVWDARARRDALGWTAEFMIPWSTLSFDPAREEWGLNVQRMIRRHEELIRWAQISRSFSGDSLQDIGRLHGLRGMDQGHGFELKPYITARYRDIAGGENEPELRAGFDASWLVTPALTATLTVNTDFAEAEADVRQVNLTRFPLFFPEKRAFFLRDAPYFAFDSGSELLVPFYSRTIGRASDGEPADILVGGKITGRVGPFTLGILDVQQRGSGDVPDKNLLAARLTAELSQTTTLGTLITNGDPYSRGGNTLAGTDLTWRTTNFFDRWNLDARAWLLGTSASGIGTNTAFGGSLYFPNLPWDLYASVVQVGEEFQPALGFVERPGVREYTGDFAYRWQVNRGGLRRFDIGLAPYLVTTLDDQLESAAHALPQLGWVWDSGDELYLSAYHKQERLFEPFEIQDGVTIDQGDFRFHTVALEFEGTSARLIAPKFGVELGEFYDGHAQFYTAGLDFRPSPFVFLGLAYEQNNVQLPAGSFTTRLATARLNLALSPRLSWNTLAQYDNESDTFGINSRIRWTVRPGTDIYLVVNQGYATEDTQRRFRLQRTLSEAAVKGGFTFLF